MKTSDAVKSAVRFEAREWRKAFTGTDFNDQPKQYPAEWAVYAADSGVRMAYAKSEESAKSAAKVWNEGRATSKTIDKADAAKDLHDLLKPGDTVYTILRNVSRSGMSRRISLLVKVENGIRDITWLAAKVLDEPTKGRAGYVQDAGITVGGCGMDMGFSLVYNLSSALFPDGFECIGRDSDKGVYCPANDHANGDRDYTPHMHNNAGGYALKHSWL